MRFARLELDQLAGAGARMPWTAAAFVFGGLSLIGVPGTAGFVSKWYLVLAALEQGALGFLVVGLIVVTSLLAIVYVWRVVEILYFAAPTEHGATVREAPWAILLPTWAVVLANVAFGLYPAFPAALARQAAVLLLGEAP
jgi:multicomponent Na+:H+ antiporter subunit D